MNGKSAMLIAALVVIVVALPAVALAQGQSDVAQVRATTAGFHNLEMAQTAGYGLVPGLDHCFDNPGVGAMGYHYINTGLLDAALNPEQPEALVYAPGPHSKLQLGAVEYVVPIDLWDAEYTEYPELFGQTFFRNADLGIYALHVWLFKHNPAGIFAAWNPEVSCP
jgi:hypothetical protein